MGHLLGIPVKPSPSLPDGAPATPCASLHHSLVRRNGSGSGGYNIFLEDSFSSAVDHGTVAPRWLRRPEPRRRDNCNSSCVKHRSRGHYSWIRKSSKRIPPLFRWPCAVPRFVPDARVSRVCISVYIMKLSLNRRNSSCARNVARVTHYNKPTPPCDVS